jgi:long-chain acyl-CoA synthetase
LRRAECAWHFAVSEEAVQFQNLLKLNDRLIITETQFPKNRIFGLNQSVRMSAPFQRLFDILPHYLEKYGDKPDMVAAKENGTWKTYSHTQFTNYAQRLACGLVADGLKPGDKVVLMANNRPEWNFTDFGVMMAGGILVPIYPTISENDLKFILSDSEAVYVIVANADLYHKVKAAASGTAIRDVFAFEGTGDVKNWSVLLEKGDANFDLAKIKAITDPIKANDLATILYTSGTTGNPKGVMLSHNNLISNFYACRNLTPADHKCRALSFLPLNHVYERMKVFMYLFLGTSVYYAEKCMIK